MTYKPETSFQLGGNAAASDLWEAEELPPLVGPGVEAGIVLLPNQ